jgi:two-component system, sensor histidine kinase PdtaS
VLQDPSDPYSYQIQRTQVKTVIDVEDVKLNIETAVPCGLVISELVSNSLKHAFPEGKKGEIRVSLRSSDDTYQLTISDNGIGLPEDSEIGKINSFGLELVNILVNQIDGKLSLDRSHGTHYTIKFKELEYKTRF